MKRFPDGVKPNVVVAVTEAVAVAVVAGALVTGLLPILLGVLIFDADVPVAVGAPGTVWFSNS